MSRQLILGDHELLLGDHDLSDTDKKNIEVIKKNLIARLNNIRSKAGNDIDGWWEYLTGGFLTRYFASGIALLGPSARLKVHRKNVLNVVDGILTKLNDNTATFAEINGWATELNTLAGKELSVRTWWDIPLFAYVLEPDINDASVLTTSVKLSVSAPELHSHIVEADKTITRQKELLEHAEELIKKYGELAEKFFGEKLNDNAAP